MNAMHRVKLIDPDETNTNKSASLFNKLNI